MPTDPIEQLCRDLLTQAIADGAVLGTSDGSESVMLSDRHADLTGMANMLRAWLAERDADENLRRVSEHFKANPTVET
jgi:hypothetical protein